MSASVLTDVKVLVGTVNLSGYVHQVQVTTSTEQVDITAMGNTARNFAPGLRVDEITIEFFQDFAAGAVDQTLSPLQGVAAGALVTVTPTSSSISSTNPSYSGTMALFDYTPLNGGVGDASMIQTTWRPAQGAHIVRGTA